MSLTFSMRMGRLAGSYVLAFFCILLVGSVCISQDRLEDQLGMGPQARSLPLWQNAGAEEKANLKRGPTTRTDSERPCFYHRSSVYRAWDGVPDFP